MILFIILYIVFTDRCSTHRICVLLLFVTLLIIAVLPECTVYYCGFEDNEKNETFYLVVIIVAAEWLNFSHL